VIWRERERQRRGEKGNMERQNKSIKGVESEMVKERGRYN
jgi:hypothetical protein